MDIKQEKGRKSKLKDHNIEVKLNKKRQVLSMSFTLGDLNKEKLTLSQDKKYYLLHIHSKLKHPDFPSDLNLEFNLQIPREKIEKEEEKIEEIVKRAFIEGDMFRTVFSQNYDGRLIGTYYGGGF